MAKSDFVRAGVEAGEALLPVAGAAARRALDEVVQIIAPAKAEVVPAVRLGTPSVRIPASADLPGARGVSIRDLITQRASETTAPANGAFEIDAATALRHSRANNGKLEALYRDADIFYSPRPRDGRVNQFTSSGYLEDASGKTHHVLIKDVGETRKINEIAGYELHKESSFTNHYPVTVERSGFIIQERLGKSLEDRAMMLDRKYYPGYDGTFVDFEERLSFQAAFDHNPRFRSQLEEALAQRTVFGDIDSHEANFAVAVLKGRASVGNIDMGKAFSLKPSPPTPLIPTFKGRPISTSTLDHISDFTDMIERPFGRNLIRELQLNEAQRAAMSNRSRWLLNTRIFPR